MIRDSHHHFTGSNKQILQDSLTGFRLRNWIILGYSVPIFLSIISALIVIFQVQAVKQTSEGLIHSAQVETKIGDFAFDIQTLSRVTRGYLLDKNAQSLDSYREAKANLPKLREELSALIQDEQQEKNWIQLQAEVQRLEQINEDLVTLIDQGKTPEAIQQWKADGGRAQAETIARLLKTFKAREEELVTQNIQHQEDALGLLVGVILLSTGLSVLIAIFVGAWVINSIAQRMAQTANTLSTSTSEIAATIEQQERTASQQAASVNETTTTMDELGASSRQSSEQAESAANAARQALQLADGGTKAVDQTLDRMNLLKMKVSAIAEQILQLSEQTTQIGSISQLVSDLANQTNMLALNAAVEAVRAGEHGKGFSVVATEIRKLADQSKQSAQKINDLVSEIQNSINSTVMVTDEGTKTVENGVQITRMTADAFAGVAEAINNVVLNNQQISLNIKQQATAIQQVINAMNTINQGAKETASGISQTKVGTQQLNEATKLLKDMV